MVGATVDVSVIIPTRLTRPDLLGEAIASVVRQTCLPAELIVVIDSGVASAESIASRLPLSSAIATRFLFTGIPEGAGVSTARNLGASAATGTHLAFLDDDDYWLPPMLAFFAPSAPDVGLSAFLKHQLDGTVVPEKVPPAHLHPRKFLVCNPGLRGSNLLIRRDLFHEVGGFAPDLPALNDLDFGIRLSTKRPAQYVRACDPRVVIRSHSGSRLTHHGSSAIADGVSRFWRRYATQMTRRERSQFWVRAGSLWGLTPPPDTMEVRA